MELLNPKYLSDSMLLEQRVMAFREIARLTTYMGLLSEESATRAPEDMDAEIIPLFP